MTKEALLYGLKIARQELAKSRLSVEQNRTDVRHFVQALNKLRAKRTTKSVGYEERTTCPSCQIYYTRILARFEIQKGGRRAVYTDWTGRRCNGRECPDCKYGTDCKYKHQLVTTDD